MKQDKYYQKARKIFFSQDTGEHLAQVFPEVEGIKIRAALYVIVGRNKKEKKQFKSRKKNGEVRIWRRL